MTRLTGLLAVLLVAGCAQGNQPTPYPIVRSLSPTPIAPGPTAGPEPAGPLVSLQDHGGSCFDGRSISMPMVWIPGSALYNIGDVPLTITAVEFLFPSAGITIEAGLLDGPLARMVPLGVAAPASDGLMAVLRDHPIVGATLRPNLAVGAPDAPRIVVVVSAPGTGRSSVNGLRLTYQVGATTRIKTLNWGLVVLPSTQPSATCGPDTTLGSPTP